MYSVEKRGFNPRRQLCLVPSGGDFVRDVADQDLVKNLKTLVSSERGITHQIIEHFEELESRKLYLALGFNSLFECAVKELKYCEGSAQRRINAMRLAREVPEVKKQLREGTVSLSSVSALESFFRNERKSGKNYSQSEKREFLEKIGGKTRRETDQLLFAVSPQSASPDQERILSSVETELRFVADQELMGLILEFKNKMASVDPNPAYRDLFKRALKLALKKPLSDRTRRHDDRILDDLRSEAGVRRGVPPPGSSEKDGERRFAPPWMRRELLRRAQSQCEFVSHVTGRRCESKRDLEIDHILPWAQGGKTTLGNLRVFCSAHNQYRAELQTTQAH